MISHNDALAAVRKQRMDYERKNKKYLSPKKYNMKATDRDELGAIFHVLASSLGEPRDYAGHWGVEYAILTLGGIFTCHYAPDDGTIFGRFENPDGVKRLPNLNLYSGKWNFHTNADSDPHDVIDTWSFYLREVLL